MGASNDLGGHEVNDGSDGSNANYDDGQHSSPKKMSPSRENKTPGQNHDSYSDEKSEIEDEEVVRSWNDDI